MNEVKKSDDLRHKILEQFSVFEPHLKAYHDYAERVAALSLEYHHARLAEAFSPPIEEGTLVCTLDVRETPKTLDTKLAEIAGLPVKRIIFDHTKHLFYIYV